MGKFPRYLATGLTVLLTVGLAACGSTSTPSTTTTAASSTSTTATTTSAASTSATTTPSGKTFTVLQAADAISLDPENTSDNVGLGIERAICEGLFGFNQHMQLEPVLAKSYTVSPDGLTYTITLKQGINFSDGTPFNAEAAMINLDRVANKANHLQKYNLVQMIKTIQVVSPYVLKITLSNPFSAFIDNLGHPSIDMLSPAALKKYGNAGIASHPVCTGPYVLSQWVHGDHITVTRNPHYWQSGKPYFDQIVFKSVPDASQRLAMLKTGEAQFVFPLSPIDAKALAGSSSVKVVNTPSIFVTYMTMNENYKPFASLDVRLALNYAINKQALISSLYQGYAEHMTSPMGSQVKFYKNVGQYTFDLAKAKQLLAAGGYPNGFSVNLWTLNDSFSQEEAVFIQQQLAQIGVKVTITPMESGTFNAAIFKGPKTNKGQLVLLGFSPSNGAADLQLRGNFATSSWPPNFFNIGFYSNHTVDQLLTSALQTADQTKEAADYAQVQQTVFHDAPWVWLVVPNNVAGEATNIQGAYVVPDQTLEVQFAKQQ